MCEREPNPRDLWDALVEANSISSALRRDRQKWNDTEFETIRNIDSKLDYLQNQLESNFEF